MADNYTHQCNAINAMALSNYTPRNTAALIWGANGPDPLFCYQMYNPFRKYSLNKLGTLMHNEKTGLFLQNLFSLAQTDTQKDYCLGFLCHYSLDSLIHPYVEYRCTAYNQKYNVTGGHSFLETALDKKLSIEKENNNLPRVEAFAPTLSKMHLEQICILLKNAIEATYPEHSYDKIEYIQAFKDFKIIKKIFLSPSRFKFIISPTIEKLLHLKKNEIYAHIQPTSWEVEETNIWQNYHNGLYSMESLDSILTRADHRSSEYINIGLAFFTGKYPVEALLEDIGNLGYETGITI